MAGNESASPGAAAKPSTNNPACIAMQALMESFVLTDNFSTETVNGQNDLLSWQYLAGKNSATGCLAKGSLLNNYTPVPTLPAPQLLYRFGVLLAANPAAHRYWPDLPVANSYEQGIAKQLGASG